MRNEVETAYKFRTIGDMKVLDAHYAQFEENGIGLVRERLQVSQKLTSCLRKDRNRHYYARRKNILRLLSNRILEKGLNRTRGSFEISHSFQ